MSICSDWLRGDSIHNKNKSKDNNLVRFMVFNATFYNISVILCQSVLLVEETGVPRENHRLVPSHWQLYYIMLYQVHLAMNGTKIWVKVVRAWMVLEKDVWWAIATWSHVWSCQFDYLPWWGIMLIALKLWV